MRIVFWKVVVGTNLLLFGTWIGKKELAALTAAEDKGFFAYSMILYLEVVEDVSAFAEGAFDETFRHYLPRYTVRMDTSAGETPLMRVACPRVSGRTLCSFCLPSLDRAVMAR